MEVKGETIDLANVATPSVEVTPENWKEQVWDPMVEYLTNNYAKNACYVTVEICWTNAEGNYVSNPVFFKWCPESGVPVKTKMMVGSCFQSIKKKLDIQGTTPELGSAKFLEINNFAKEAKLKGWVDQ